MDNNSLLLKVLQSRGLTDQKEIKDFLNPSLDNSWTNPYEINGLNEVANTIDEAIKLGKRIMIYGDYDLDGISSIAVMLLGLKKINEHINNGMSLDFFIPDRFEEGYGFSEKSVDRLLKLKVLPDLIITVDCGVTADREIKILKEHGIDVVVTDHHEKSDFYPTDCYVCDPKADGDEKNTILAGVGVSLKLIQMLGNMHGLPNLWLDFIDIASLGTLADIMPLIGQNRALVSEGMKKINDKTRVCIKALMDVANKKCENMTSTDISYVITPRLNAAGRLGRAEVALALLLTDNYADAFNKALEIENLNNKRRKITDEIFEKANYKAKNLLQNNPNIKCIVVSSNGWHIGVIGIVAAKLAEIYNLPSFVFTLDGNNVIGSGRSCGVIDLHNACVESFNKYIKFGGHANACGLTLQSSNLKEFTKSINLYMQKQDNKSFEKQRNFDLQIQLSSLTTQNIEMLSVLEPFGNKNEQPLFLTKNVFIKKGKAVGAKSNHLSCYLSDGAYEVPAIMFNVAKISNYLNCDSLVSVIYNPKIDYFQGRQSIKLHISDIIIHDISDEEDVLKKNEYLNRLFNIEHKINVSDNCDKDFISNNLNFYNQDLTCDNNLDNNFNIKEQPKNNFLKNLSKNEIQNKIIESIIGKDNCLHKSQKKCLDLLVDGKNVLAIMPTARGKSLIFQTYASMLAIFEKKMSIFVYPLRALISDQVFHIQNSLNSFGINVVALSGETSNADRNNIYKNIENNKVDILLTTPEFLAIHIDKICKAPNIGFIVLDEVHYLGKVKIGNRSAYGHLPNIIDKLKKPQVLGLSATINNEILNEITTFINVDQIVKDNFERANLFIDDRRNIKCRDDYLVSLCASGQKILIYVNSRQQTIDLARMIKSRAPQIAMKVGFYNGGMSKNDRNKIEDLFRDNTLSVLIATSAFGEGVNISDIRHVCLYHLPFSNVEFNQMAGRCGRDNNTAIIHLLYNRSDESINTKILNMCNPDRDILAKIYFWLKNCCNKNGEFTFKFSDLEKMCLSGLIPAASESILCAFHVFCELGLIDIETYIKDKEKYSKISIVNLDNKVDLEHSSRFCEGQNELKKFEEYKKCAMQKTAEDLTKMLRHPILPEEIVSTK